MNANGKLYRLYPVPFRLIDGAQQFKKWQWVDVRLDKAPKDHRPESHKIFVDTVNVQGSPISTANGWRDRREYIAKLSCLPDHGDLERSRLSSGTTLGLIRPSRVIGLDITPAKSPTWTQDEMDKLLQSQQQAGLFDNSDAKTLTTLRKLPFDFHYRYECNTENGVVAYRHKIADWEAGALYWNCFRRDPANWETAFRAKMEIELPAADLMFLMGTIHRFPDQWLIVSLIYPPKQPPALPDPQMTLAL